MKRYESAKRRCHKRQRLQFQSPKSTNDLSDEDDLGVEEIDNICPLPSKNDESCTPDGKVSDETIRFEVDCLRQERNNALDQIKLLQKQLLDARLSARCIYENDSKCHYYTGIHWDVFIKTFNFLDKFTSQKIEMSKMDQFFITIVKLRFDMPFQFLADRTGYSETTVIKIFWHWINLMFNKLSFLVKAPDQDAVRRTLPVHFKEKFPRLTTIIDCFEIFIERPKNLKARATTYSNYKKHNTVKFLIGCTPVGSVSFLSKGWGGRVSDCEIVRKSGFLDSNRHFPGDEILADRGFTVQEEMAVSCGAHLIIPSFARGKKQLSAQEVENSRKIASVRIHIERIIGLMKNRYSILQGTLPIKVIKSVKDEAQRSDKSNIDKLVLTCAILVNLGDGIV